MPNNFGLHAKKLQMLHHKIHGDEPFKLNWYVRTTGPSVGTVTALNDLDDTHKDIEKTSPGIVLMYMPMDGQWRSVEQHLGFIKNLEYLQENMVPMPWYLRRGDGFAILDYYDNEGNPKL